MTRLDPCINSLIHSFITQIELPCGNPCAKCVETAARAVLTEHLLSPPGSIYFSTSTSSQHPVETQHLSMAPSLDSEVLCLGLLGSVALEQSCAHREVHDIGTRPC